MSDDAPPLCACEQYYDSHHPECPARRAYEALASRLGTAEKLLREWVDWHEDLRPTMPITRTRDFISPAEAPAVETPVTDPQEAMPS